MQNKIFFVRPGYIQPENYRLIFCNWVAVYSHPYSKEKFHLEMESDYLHRKKASSLSILRQDADCRKTLYRGFKSIKAAAAKMEQILFQLPVTSQAQDLVNCIRKNYIEQGFKNHGIYYPSQEQLPLCGELMKRKMIELSERNRIAYQLSLNERRWLAKSYTLSERWIKPGREYRVNNEFEELVSLTA